jgi:serine/threonine-protein kinase
MKKSYTINIPVKTFWRVIVPLLIFSIACGSLIGILIIDRFVMPKIIGVKKDLVAVPTITNTEFEEGRQKLFNIGLRCETKTREYSDHVQKGYIINQNPPAQTQVKKGRQIDIILSKGPEIAVIPDIQGIPQQQAVIQLHKSGFDVGKLKKVYSDTIPKDQIVNTVPETGTTISKEIPVDLQVSNGPKPTHAEAPNIVGERIEDARAKIEENGLVVGKVDYKDNPSLKPGTVISQSVPPGTTIPLENAINIVVSVIGKK